MSNCTAEEIRPANYWAWGPFKNRPISAAPSYFLAYVLSRKNMSANDPATLVACVNELATRLKDKAAVLDELAAESLW